MKTTMRIRLQVLCPLVFLMAGTLSAQEKTEVPVDAIVLRVNGDTNHKPFVVVSSNAAKMLDELTRDTRTDLVTHSALRGTEGVKSELKVGSCVQFCVGVNLEVTPSIESSGDLMLHVLVSQVFASEYANLGSLRQTALNHSQNTFDVKAASGETTLLGGLWPIGAGKPGSLVIALTPRIVR
jgi:hypothetical protein